MKKLFFIFLILVLTLPAYGETLWVRHGLTTGNNTGSDYNNAFQGPDNIKWGRGAGKVGAGDRLYICGGSYDDSIVVGASGTLGNYITLDGNCSSVKSGYTNGIIGRVALANVSTSAGQSISLYNDEYIIIQNLTFRNPFGVRGYTTRGGVPIKLRNYAKYKNPMGKHNGADNADYLSDSRASYPNDAWIGGVIFNITDGSRGIITDNDRTTITATLSGGTENDWDYDSARADGDKYRVLDDSGSIRIYGKSNNIIIQNCKFDLSNTNIGPGILLNLQTTHSVHDITIQHNTFSGDGDSCIYALLSGSKFPRLYNITIADNLATNIFQFYTHHIPDRDRANIDPDLDGDTSDDYAPYGIDIRNNAITTVDDYRVISIAGLHEVSGSGYNYIRGNTITASGTQTPYTNLLQLNWVKDLVIEKNIIKGPSLKSHCDGAALILDWHFVGLGKDVADDYISDGVIIRNNVISNASSTCSGKGIAVYRGRNIQIYNNLIYDSDIGIKVSSDATAGQKTDNVTILSNTIDNSKTDGIVIVNSNVPSVKIKNNIISASGDDGIDDNSGNIADTDEDYNLIYNSSSHDCEGKFGVRRNNTCGSNDITGKDPLLDSNYRIKSTSPAKNSGNNSVAQKSFCDGAIDMGFWEICSAKPDAMSPD